MAGVGGSVLRSFCGAAVLWRGADGVRAADHPGLLPEESGAVPEICRCGNVAGGHRLTGGLQGLKVIPGLAEALFAVLDGGRGAVADTGHAVGAAFAPDGPAVPEGDAVGGTAAGAPAAAGAGLRNGKGAGFDEAGIEDGVHRPAHEAVIETIVGRGKGAALPDGGDRTVDIRLGLGHDASGFLRLRSVKHGDVVLRHDDLGCPHVRQALGLTEGAIIPAGVADLAAAGHDEPRLRCAGELRLQQPVPHQTGDAPCVGRRDDHKALVRLHGGGVVGADAVIHAQQRLVQSLRHALGHIFAVAGAGKIEDHMKTPLQNVFNIVAVGRKMCKQAPAHFLLSFCGGIGIIEGGRIL